MSQVFAADGVTSAGPNPITTTAPTFVVAGNFVSPPFGTAKALVVAQVNVTAGTGTTAITVKILRNANAENLQVGQTLTMSVTAGNTYVVGVMGVDSIPDGRPVQYWVQIAQTAATGNGSWSAATVAVWLISG
jgi:hypothetical protein